MRKMLFLALVFVTVSTCAQDPPVARFFRDLCLCNTGNLIRVDDGNFKQTCEQLGLDDTDAGNISNYALFELLHKMFNCGNAANGSCGVILKMPYFWHYNTPNPRHDIIVDGRRNIGYVNIERKPHFFLGDMVAPRARFSHPDFGTFSSFGWCSEREMAFTCLLVLMGYDAHVISPGAHAWTEVAVPFKTREGAPVNILITVDNTFNSISYSTEPPSDHKNIYDTRALAPAEVERVQAITVPPEARSRINAAVDSYFARR